MSKKKLIPVFDMRKISAHVGAVPVRNFTLEIILNFSFDGTLSEAREKLDEDIKSFEEEITEGLTGTGLEYAVGRKGTIYQHELIQGETYNFTLEVILYFSFDGTEDEAREKLAEDMQSFEKIITEGMTGTGLEYAVVSSFMDGWPVQSQGFPTGLYKL